MVSAFNDRRGGNEGHLCITAKVGKVCNSAVAHGGFHLVKAFLHVVVERAGVNDVGIHALFKGKLRLSAEVVSLPVAGAVRAFAPIFFDIGAVYVELTRRAFVKARKVASEHEEVSAHRKRKRHVIVVDDAAVRADRDIHAGLLEVLVARRRDLDDGACLSASYSLLLTGNTDRASADTDLDKVRTRFGEEEEAVAVNDVSGTDLDAVTVLCADKVDRLLLPAGISFGGVNAEDIRARFDKRGNALLIIERVDSGADKVSFLRVENLGPVRTS